MRPVRLTAGRECSGALEVFEGCGQAEWLVEDERAVVHGLDHVPARDLRDQIRHTQGDDGEPLSQ